MNDSRGRRPPSGPFSGPGFGLLLRGFLALCGALGVALLVLTTRATVIQIRIGESTPAPIGIDTTLSGADRHGVALIVVAVFGAMMLAGALQHASPAAFGLGASGVIALGIAILGDARHIHDTGMIGVRYADSTAGAGTGFYLETLGGALLLMAGGGLLLLGVGSRPDARADSRPAPRPFDVDAAPQAAANADDEHPESSRITRGPVVAASEADSSAPDDADEDRAANSTRTARRSAPEAAAAASGGRQPGGRTRAGGRRLRGLLGRRSGADEAPVTPGPPPDVGRPPRPGTSPVPGPERTHAQAPRPASEPAPHAGNTPGAPPEQVPAPPAQEWFTD